MADFDQPIIIKRVKKAAHVHHGGAWKIAYADFVTAMMAFFLLLWLISMTTPEQKAGLATYFSPPHISETTSGAGGVLGGASPSEAGAQRAGASADVIANGSQDSAIMEPKGNASNQGRDSASDLRSKQEMAFHSAAVSIRQAWQALPDITSMADNLLVEQTEEGLNIQIVEQSGQRMFANGSKYPLEHTRKALAAIAPILQQLSNQIHISGHTVAGMTFRDPRYGSWDLSSDRANVVREVLGEFGLSEDHIHSVSGRSTEEPFFPNDPYLAANERVSMTLVFGEPPIPSDLKP